MIDFYPYLPSHYYNDTKECGSAIYTPKRSMRIKNKQKRKRNKKGGAK